MARLKPPYATTAQLTAAVMQERDLAYDTTLDRFVMGDGVNAAGKPLAFLSDVGGAPISSAMTPVVQAATLDIALRLLLAGGNYRWTTAAGDGVTDDTSALNTDSALGQIVLLEPGATYLTSSGVAWATGTWFVCIGGVATIKAKTGSGGFNIKNVGGTRTDADRCMIRCIGIDNFGARNIHFTTDGATEVALYPVRISGGCATHGFDFENISFSGFHASVLFGVNSAGAGRKRNVHIASATSCGITQGSSYWTGTPQTTVLEIDNDIVSSTPSKPIVARIDLVKDILFSGTALTDFAQQTDVVNVVGQGANSSSGHDITVGHVDGVGELFDFQGWNITGRCGTAKNIYNDVVKLIHGAQYCSVEIGAVEASGRSVAAIFGSTTADRDSIHNTVRIGTVKTPGTYGLGTSGETSIVLFGNTTSTYKPKRNFVYVDNFLGDGTTLDYAVRDGGTDQSNANEVHIGRGSGFAVAASSAPPGNVRVHCSARSYTELALSGNQTVTTATDTKLAFAESILDIEAIADTGNNRIRPVWPGLYRVEAQVRVDSWNAGVNVRLNLKKNATSIYSTRQLLATNAGSSDETPRIDATVYIDEDDVGGATADISIEIRHDAGSDRTVTDSNTLTYFKVVRVN